ncbi:MAG: tetratricopeptide repeat protein [Rhodospirillales bacterium]
MTKRSILGANGEAQSEIYDAVRAFTLYFGDPNIDLVKAREADPSAQMPDILQSWFLALSNDSTQLKKAIAIIETVDETRLTEREGYNLVALRLALAGQWPSAVDVLDRHLMEDPFDLAAHQCALRLDGYLGRFAREAARASRALPFWSVDDPNYGIMLSFFGFGLEEFGDFARAEDVSREAAELEPFAYWPHHAVSHVLEMTGRPDEGVKWMDDRLPFWSDPKCNNRVHIYWHKALFHVERGEFDRALALYDNEILSMMRPVGTQLCNPTSLLWRLQTLGCDPGDRWGAQFCHWEKQLSGMVSPFNEIHGAMAALSADDFKAYDNILLSMKRSAASGSELSETYKHCAIPITEAMACFVRGEYIDALEGLLGARAQLSRMGGSIAQRDLIEWTILVAAIRACARNTALSLAHERLAFRPDSAVNNRFLEQARALAA